MKLFRSTDYSQRRPLSRSIGAGVLSAASFALLVSTSPLSVHAAESAGASGFLTSGDRGANRIQRGHDSMPSARTGDSAVPGTSGDRGINQVQRGGNVMSDERRMHSADSGPRGSSGDRGVNRVYQSGALTPGESRMHSSRSTLAANETRNQADMSRGATTTGDRGKSRIWSREGRSDSEPRNRLFAKLDSNGDKVVSQSEAKAEPTVDRLFDYLDDNGDGRVTKAEFEDISKKVNVTG